MKNLFRILTIACLLLTIGSCSKKDTRNIVIGQNYTVVAIDDLTNGHADLISSLFDQAPGVRFKLNENQLGTISDGVKTYTFAWKYQTPGYGGIEIEFQKPEQYPTDVANILIKMSGGYSSDRTNGVRISPNEGIDMDNEKAQIRMAAT